MNDVSHRESFAFSARVLGALFYFAPDSEQTAPLVSALTAGDWMQDWPLAQESLQPVASMFKNPSDEALKDAWQRLFIGPYALPAPRGAPSGSIASPCCLAIRPLHCASGCVKTISPLRYSRMSRKITSERC